MSEACDVCGAEDRPAERTTVDTIAPLEADVCEVCQLVQDHSMADGRCAQCGDELDGVGFHLEIEFPLGAADLPANVVVDLCGDCAAWVGHHINYRGVQADEAAHARYLELIEAAEPLSADREGGAA